MKLGKYYQSLSSGLSFINPFFDKVSRIVSLKEQVVDFDPQAVITKDNATMQIDTVVYFQITDPKLYTYGVERPLSAIENLTATTLRNIIGDMTVDETLTSRDIINTKMRQEDPTWVVDQSKELRQIIIHGQGEFHLRTLKWRLENNEKILIYGDYDADGITSTTILTNFFKESN